MREPGGGMPAGRQYDPRNGAQCAPTCEDLREAGIYPEDTLRELGVESSAENSRREPRVRCSGKITPLGYEGISSVRASDKHHLHYEDPEQEADTSNHNNG